jgi:hypothetical protein
VLLPLLLLLWLLLSRIDFHGCQAGTAGKLLLLLLWQSGWGCCWG